MGVCFNEKLRLWMMKVEEIVRRLHDQYFLTALLETASALMHVRRKSGNVVSQSKTSLGRCEFIIKNMRCALGVEENSFCNNAIKFCIMPVYIRDKVCHWLMPSRINHGSITVLDLIIVRRSVFLRSFQTIFFSNYGIA